jgi:hypothetical protein
MLPIPAYKSLFTWYFPTVPTAVLETSSSSAGALLGTIDFARNGTGTIIIRVHIVAA